MSYDAREIYPPERVRYVGMGAIFVGRAENLVIQAPNLGSCIGVALYDFDLKAGAMAHIVLPKATDGRTSNLLKYADTALPLVLEKFYAMAGYSSRLSCKIAGGAQMFSDEMHIGQRNIQAVEAVLQELTVPIRSWDVGGEISRTMNLYLNSGLVTIRVAGESQERLL